MSRIRLSHDDTHAPAAPSGGEEPQMYELSLSDLEGVTGGAQQPEGPVTRVDTHERYNTQSMLRRLRLTHRR